MVEDISTGLKFELIWCCIFEKINFKDWLLRRSAEIHKFVNSKKTKKKSKKKNFLVHTQQVKLSICKKKVKIKNLSRSSFSRKNQQHSLNTHKVQNTSKYV